ncbi:MAG: SEL1-like repeat protein [Chthoniobacterales bacterium]|nr:SEL1-like repeat protein [Chthoniobacterales bacterium]MBA3606943.1 SEL1-like repeat protein [Chthoniobacterales bacterium]
MLNRAFAALFILVGVGALFTTPLSGTTLAEAAENGDSEAQYNLGMMYLTGLGVPQDDGTGFRWIRKAAEHNHAEAEFILGLMFDEGRATSKDEGEAAKWYRKAADQNEPRAQHQLARAYALGRGVTQDLREAARWYKLAAQQGLVDAQSSLALLYETGTGEDEDQKEALRWYLKAAQQGDAEAQFHAGLILKDGLKDPKNAVRLFRSAATQGNADAQILLGIMCAYGSGTPKNYVEAYKWLSLGVSGQAESDDAQELAKKHLAALETRLMTREQIAEAQRASVEFVPKAQPSSQQARSRTTDAADQINQLKATGTAFAVTKDGYLLTNLHVVGASSRVKVSTSSGIRLATIVKTDQEHDVALLKVDSKLAALPVIDSSSVRLGQTVFAIGFPNVGVQGLKPKLTKGEISSLAGIQDDDRYFQISVPLQPGNSGGPLVDMHGNVVGITSAGLNAARALDITGSLPQNVNYAVKSAFLIGFLKSVPKLAARLPPAHQSMERPFEDVVQEAQGAVALVLVY